jgi:two-component system response regulator AlgR
MSGMSAAVCSVLVVDDEAPARERLSRLIEELDGYAVAGEAGSGGEALDLVGRLQPQVVLLDIRMPGMSGIETARHLMTMPEPPAVIFTTAYDEYALEAFDSQAMGYLLKPVRRERLARALEHAVRVSGAQLNQLIQRDVPGSRRQNISVRVRDEFRLIPIRDIVVFRADQKYVTVCHRNGEELIDESLKALGDELESDFVRVHRSFLVAVDCIARLEKDAESKPVLRVRDYPDPIPVSRRQLAELKRRLRSPAKSRSLG